MDIDQLRKTVEWLDDERRKDKAETAVLQERLIATQSESAAVSNRLQRLEAELSAANALLQRVSRIDELLDGLRTEVTRQIAAAEQRRAEAEREADRLRQIEREGFNRAIGELRKPIESLPRIEQDLAGRKEEEKRVSKALLDLRKKIGDFVKHDEDRVRVTAVLEEARRQDSKRIVELQTETAEMRKRTDEHKGRFDVLEDIARRNDTRLNEVVGLEAERRAAQAAWLEQQALLQADHERWWNEFKDRADKFIAASEDYSRRMDAYGETHRSMKQVLEEYNHVLERMERRINEMAEIQRLAEDRFRQEWNAFLADDQKRWTTHMLLRDEQWREHDRNIEKLVDRLSALEDSTAGYDDRFRNIKTTDTARLQSLAAVVREWLAEYDQAFVKVR